MRVRVVLVIAFGYAGLMLLTLWQALRGQPLASPDALTWFAVAALTLAVGLGPLGIVHAPEARPRSRRTRRTAGARHLP